MSPLDPGVLRDEKSPFQLLDDAEIAELGAHVDEHSFAAGETVFATGEAGGTSCCPAASRCRSTTPTDAASSSRRSAGAASSASYRSSTGSRDRPRVVALEPTRTFRIERHDLERLFRSHPAAALDVLAVMARRLRETDRLLSQRVSRNANEVLEEKSTFGERVADAVARFGGSWSFIFSFGGILLAWVSLNTWLLLGRRGPFNPYPFILLNLFLSMLAALQAPVIMMSQNRQDAKDRVRSELDYRVNLKAELGVTRLLEKFDRLERRLERVESGAPASKAI